MSDSLQHFKLIRDERGVVTVSIDVQGSPVNLFSDEVVLELAHVVDELERSAPKLVVFRSYKPAGFLAGADVRRIRQIATADEAAGRSRSRPADIQPDRALALPDSGRRPWRLSRGRPGVRARVPASCRAR